MTDLLFEHGLPDWSARVPVTDDIDVLTALVRSHQRRANGSASVDREWVASAVTGSGSWTRRQLAVEDATGRLIAWMSVHDRAAGRTNVELTVAPDTREGDAVAGALLFWAAGTARAVAAQRGLAETQLDATLFARDERQQRWFAAAGYRRTRTWLRMTRPVDRADPLWPTRAGVTVRPVDQHAEAMPVAADLQVVHQMLEESFTDHFNSYRESFPEFVQRLREDPGHRWDHWFIAEVDVDGARVPGGALVSSVLGPDDTGHEGSYVDYIGVHRRARGLGVAKSLLGTVIRDARDRGRNRVDLEVDADSPTGADGLYLSLGWATKYRTESWHATSSV